MEYLGIKNLLSRFHKSLTFKKETEEAVFNILKELVNIEIPIENISYKNKKIQIKTRQLIKTEIMLKKDKILNLLKEQGFKVEDIF